MRLVLDGQPLQGPSRHRGIGRYARCLVRSLAEHHREIAVVVHEDLPSADTCGIPEEHLLPFRPPLPREPRNRAANELYYADWLAARHPELLLLLSPFDLDILHPRFIGLAPPSAAVVYDLIPLLFHHHYLTSDEQTCAYAQRVQRVCAADLILAISEATARDVRTLLREARGRVLAVGGAPDPHFGPLAPDRADAVHRRLAARFGITNEFILYVGGSDRRKNMLSAVLAFGALPAPARERLELVIACEMTPTYRAGILATARSLGIAKQVRIIGFVDEDDLRALYQTCRVFFFPSLYEGLGLPIVEALSCGAPVVASDRSSMPEVAGTVSWLADPYDEADLARALEEALETPRAQGADERRRWALHFDWSRVAERALSAFDEALSAPRPTVGGRRDGRPRVAWVSPLPPATSGISDYSAELLDHLSARFDIEVVVDPDQPPVDPDIAKRHVVVLASELELRHEAKPFDLFVYQLGASTFHLYMLALLLKFPGLLVLHEFALSGLAREAVKLGIWPGGTEQAADGRTPDDDGGDAPPLLAAADVVLVHTRWAWQRARRACRRPVVHVPQAIAIPELRSPSEERRRLQLQEDSFVVATLGRVGPLKRIPSILRAVSGLPDSLRARSIVLVVGDTDEGERGRLDQLAEDLGLGGQVRFTGRVPLADLGAYASAADACVQLRYPTQGEASASLLRALAAGAACIVSDEGSSAELEEAVALRVRSPDHEVADVRAALLRLHHEPPLSSSLRAAARRYIHRERRLEQVAPRYAAAMQLAIARRAARGGLWAELAVDSLSRAGAHVPDTLIRRWADLHVRGESTHPVRPPGRAASLPPDAGPALGDGG